MHILFIGYGKTSQRSAKHLFALGHQITTISRSPKTDTWATHLIQDIHHLDLSQLPAIDWVYILLSPDESSESAYQKTYLDSVLAITQALKNHPVQRVVVLSSTRVYGENAGQYVDDETPIQPIDAQGQILHEMEQCYLVAFPERCTIIRPSGIYGTSVARMQKMANNLNSYPNLHWSNRIHIEDLANFLCYLLHVEHLESSYILTNNQPQLLHKVLQWFQAEMRLDLLTAESNKVTGKKLYATRMQQMGFKLEHPDCFADYLSLMNS